MQQYGLSLGNVNPVTDTEMGNVAEDSQIEAVGGDTNKYLPGSHQKSFEPSLDSLFSNTEEENKIQKARAVLGEIARDIPDDQLVVYLTQFQCLVDDWLDNYEKQLFNGATLKQLLREG